MSHTNSVWGTGCDDAWSTGGATVVCQQLEYSTRSEVAHMHDHVTFAVCCTGDKLA